MFTRGYAKHPCTQHVYSQGFAVDRVERYGCIRMRTRGDLLYTQNLCLTKVKLFLVDGNSWAEEKN